MRSRMLCMMTAAALLPLTTAPLLAQTWPHWRGPQRNDVVDESSGWSESGWIAARPVWNTRVGEGSTSPLVVGQQLYVMGWREGRDHVLCLNAATGKQSWSVSYECPQYGRHATGDEGLYSGPTATPEYDAQTGWLYTLSCNGDLHCWATDTRGQKVWSVNLYDKYSVQQRPKVGRSGLRDYGYTASPLVYGDWVIVEVGAAQGTLVALNKETGEEVWRSEARMPAGHTGGLVPIEVEHVPCVAVMTFDGLLITRLDKGHEGQTVATYPWKTEFAQNIATPAVHHNFVVITSGYNHQAICKLEITLRGARKVWQQSHASLICSPLIHKGHVYWAWQQLHCLDFETGEQQWAGGSYGDPGSLIITSDDRLISWGGRGRLALVDSAIQSPTAYRELAHVDTNLPADAWPHVVLAGGRIFCKDRVGNLACYAK